MEIWEPKPPGTLWATPGLLRDSFTFLFICLLNFPAFSMILFRLTSFFEYFLSGLVILTSEKCCYQSQIQERRINRRDFPPELVNYVTQS